MFFAELVFEAHDPFGTATPALLRVTIALSSKHWYQKRRKLLTSLLDSDQL